MIYLIALFLISSINANYIFDARKDTQEYGKVKSLMVCIGDQNTLGIGDVLRGDLEFTDQIEVDLKKAKREPSKRAMSKFFKEGISIYSTMKKISQDRLHLVSYDTSTNKPVFDKIFTCNTDKIVDCANHISSRLLPALTGEAGITMYDLAYCKLLNPKHKVICVSNYDAKSPRVVASMNTVNILPCWHKEKDLLFYSQLTKQNTRLMAVDLATNRHKVISSFDGLNMQPSLSRDGKKVVLCLSRSGNSELYLYDTQISKDRGARVFKQLTNNGGSNVSPCLLENGDVIFCSDYKTGVPQIYYLDVDNNQVRQLTTSGYCARPSYCEKTKTIVFTKPVRGTFQLFKVNLEDKAITNEEQLTFNEGDKHDPCLSECGKYVVFSYRVADADGDMAPQIAALNISSSKIRLLTRGKEPKSFPVWRSRG